MFATINHLNLIHYRNLCKLKVQIDANYKLMQIFTVNFKLKKAGMFRFKDDDYSASSQTLPKSTFRSEVYQPSDERHTNSLSSDEPCNCCGVAEAPPRKDSLQRRSPPPVPPHRVHLRSCEAKGMKKRNGKYPDCSCGYKWERDFQSTDDSSM